MTKIQMEYPSECNHRIITQYGCIRRCGCVWISQPYNKCVSNDNADQFQPYNPEPAPECDTRIIYGIYYAIIIIEVLLSMGLIITITIMCYYDSDSSNIIY